MEGPLMQIGETDCTRELQKFRGTVLAVKKVCRWSYRFVPGSETAPADDYFVDWMQATVDPRPGYCVVVGEAQVGRTPGEISAMSAGYPDRVRTRHEDVISLTATAEGNAASPASVSQQFAFAPGRMMLETFENNAALAWEGKTRRTLALGVGIESAHAPIDEAGVFEVRAGLYAEVKSC